MHSNGFGLRCRCAARGGAEPAAQRPFPLPGDAPRWRRARPFDVVRLALDVTLDVPRRSVRAAASLTVARRDPDARTLCLDAVDFAVASAALREGSRERPLPWRYDGERLAVTLPDGPWERCEVVLRYEATPRRGLRFLAPDEAVPTRPAQVWSQGQDEDARHWIPCHDAPDMRMATSLAVTAPAAWTVLSNGRLEGCDDVGDGARRWRWVQDEPHPSYLITLAAGTFVTLDDTRGGAVPIRYLVDPGREEDALRTLGRTPEMLARFEQLTGVRYPWAKYDQVCVHDFNAGGMENTSATTLTERCLLDARAALDVSADELVAHELAHQWFGDLVTCRDWSHAWLNEGFATLFEHLDLEAKQGADAYAWSLREHAEVYFAEDAERYRRALVTNVWAAPFDVFDRHLYEKGGWVLHMLRRELGDAAFWRGVNLYLTRHRGGSVETRDLLRAMEDATGASLGAFFAQWAEAAGYPELEVELGHDDGALRVNLRQTHARDAQTPVFRFTLRGEVVDGSGAARPFALRVDDEAHAFSVPCAEPPSHVALDPDGDVLMRLTLRAPPRWSLDALRRGRTALTRARAAATLARRDDGDTVEALARAVRDDAFWGVSAEAARALGEVRSGPARDALLRCAEVSHPKARRAVARALGEFREPAVAAALAARLAAGDPSVMVESELARSLGRTRAADAYDALVAATTRASWRDVVCAGALEGLGALRDARAVPLLVAHLRPARALGVRRAAAEALGEFAGAQRDAREALESLLGEDDPYLVPEALRALARARDVAALPAVARCAARSGDAMVRRAAREALRALERREGDAELHRLRDEVARLRDETRALRDDVARLRDPVLGAQGARASTSRRTAAKARRGS